MIVKLKTLGKIEKAAEGEIRHRLFVRVLPRSSWVCILRDTSLLFAVHPLCCYIRRYFLSLIHRLLATRNLGHIGQDNLLLNGTPF